MAMADDFTSKLSNLTISERIEDNKAKPEEAAGVGLGLVSSPFSPFSTTKGEEFSLRFKKMDRALTSCHCFEAVAGSTVVSHNIGTDVLVPSLLLVDCEEGMRSMVISVYPSVCMQSHFGINAKIIQKAADDQADDDEEENVIYVSKEMWKFMTAREDVSVIDGCVRKLRYKNHSCVLKEVTLQIDEDASGKSWWNEIEIRNQLLKSYVIPGSTVILHGRTETKCCKCQSIMPCDVMGGQIGFETAIVIDFAKAPQASHPGAFEWKRTGTELLAAYENHVIQRMDALLLNTRKLLESQSLMLVGPAGTGKTFLVEAMCQKYDISLIQLDMHHIQSMIVKAKDIALRRRPSVVLIEHLDILLGNGDDESEWNNDNKVLIPQLLSLLSTKTNGILIIYETQQERTVNSLIRSKMDLVIRLNPFSTERRATFYRALGRKYPSVDIDVVIAATHAIDAGDICKLFCIAKELSFNNNSNNNVAVSTENVLEAMPQVKPAILEEHFGPISTNVTWQDVGGLDDLKQILFEVIIWPERNPELFASMGLNNQNKRSKSVLMHGPPGTGKTLIAMATASEAKMNFLSVDLSKIVQSVVGGSERVLGDIFERAALVAPCILFLDELQALFVKRGDSSQGQQQLLSQLILQLDQLVVSSSSSQKSVYVLAATNLLEFLDPALLRPGRFEYVVYVGVPDEKGRREIVRRLMSQVKISQEDAEQVEILMVDKTEGKTGAEIESIFRKAATVAFKNKDVECLTHDHFKEALLL